MNILQIVPRLDANEKTQDVIASTRFLTLNGHKLVVVSGGGAFIAEIDGVGARHYTLHLKPNIFSFPFYIFKLAGVIAKENVDVVHARDGLSAFIAFFASRLTERVFVTTVYGHGERGIFGRALFWAKRVICFDESQARFFIAKGLVQQDKVCVIPPFVREDKNRRRERPPELRNCFVIGVVLPLWSPEETQNFIRFISVLSRTIYKLKVFILGAVSRREKEAREKLILLIKRRLLEDVMALRLGEDTGEIIPILDLFIQVHPDFAKFALQAQAAGVAVVTMNAREENGLKKTQDKVLELYRDESLRKKIADEAKRCVKEKFNIKKIMESTVKIYKEVPFSKKILIIKIGALGDVILAVPSVRAIRKKFENAKIELLVGLKYREVFDNSPFLDDIIVCDFEGRDRGLGGLLRLGKRLRAEDFDIVVDFQNNKKSHILSLLSCAPKRYGYNNGKFSFLLNRKIKDTGLPADPVKHQSRVLGLLGIHSVENKLELWPSREDDEWAARFLKSHWLKNKAKLVAVNMGASPRWITKLWPVEHFAEVCDRLARDFGIRAVLIGAERDDPRIKEFLDKSKSKPIDACGRTNIPRLASLLKKCDLLVSSDSAPVHVAASVGTPFVALFGPTDPKRHLPPAEKYIVCRKNLKCSPCYRTYCRRHHKCMRSIKPNEVYEAILELMGVKTKKIPNNKLQIPSKLQSPKLK